MIFYILELFLSNFIEETFSTDKNISERKIIPATSVHFRHSRAFLLVRVPHFYVSAIYFTGQFIHYIFCYNFISFCPFLWSNFSLEFIFGCFLVFSCSKSLIFFVFTCFGDKKHSFKDVVLFTLQIVDSDAKYEMENKFMACEFISCLKLLRNWY